MSGMVIELIAYLFILPIRVVGWLGGERARNWSRRAERWLLRQAWSIGSTGLTGNPYSGLDSSTNHEAANSVAALEFDEEAHRQLSFSDRELQRGPRYVEGGSPDMTRSEQMKDAMLEAQRRERRSSERSAHNLKRRH